MRQYHLDSMATTTRFMERGFATRSLALGRVDGIGFEFATGFTGATDRQAKA